MNKMTTLFVALMMVVLGSSEALAQRGSRGQQRNKTERVAGQARPQQHSKPVVWSRTKQRIVMYRAMQKQSFNAGKTPAMFLVANKDGVRMNPTREASYKKGTTQAIEVSGLSADGALEVTALIPVSVHTGEGETFAKTNVYNFTVTHPDGTRQTLEKVPSKGFITEKVLNLKLKPGKTIVKFWPEGAPIGGDGYKAGREIELNWNGK